MDRLAVLAATIIPYWRIGDRWVTNPGLYRDAIVFCAGFSVVLLDFWRLLIYSLPC